MARRTLVPAMLLLSVTALVFGMLWAGAEQRCKRAAAIASELSRLRTTNSALQDSISLLTRELAHTHEYPSFSDRETVSTPRNQGMLLGDIDIRSLRRMGLQDPVNDLRQDLLAHPELIPFDGVLGGKMGFMEDRIVLLSRRWVFAGFEDGHIVGCCLLSYEVTPDAGISWKVLSAVLE